MVKKRRLFDGGNKELFFLFDKHNISERMVVVGKETHPGEVHKYIFSDGNNDR